MKLVTKVKNIQRILNNDPDGAKLVVDGIIGPKTEAAFRALKPTLVTHSGTAGWYSQYSGRFHWVDREDGIWNSSKTIYLGPNNALGVPDNQQGIALPTRDTLGDWFWVTAPNGVELKLQQTDIGPASSTGRKIDIAAVAAERLGYTPSSFPTNEGIFTWRPA